MGLREYRAKRNFRRTSEPRGQLGVGAKYSYLIQQHAASRLHYDLRLEARGVLLSWAVPKGPSLDPQDKRLAVQVEDHPLDYGTFEGIIPRGGYGAGSVLLWDRGTWQPEGDPSAGLAKGKLEFELFGEKLRGGWKLIRMRDRNGGKEKKNWLLMKRADKEARREGHPIVEERPESVASGLEIHQIAKEPVARASSGRRRTRLASPNRKRSLQVPRTQSASKLTSAPRRRAAVAKAARAKSKQFRSLTHRLGDLPGARKAALPGFTPLQLATLVKAAPDGEGWIHEVKYDGYRMLAQIERGEVRWFSRNGLDWSKRFHDLSEPLRELPAKQALIDGEVVVLDEQGVSQFQRLQQALGEKAPQGLAYFAFDVLHLDGWDLRACKLIDRKRVLRDLIGRVGKQSVLRYSEHVVHGAALFLAAACEHKLEGVVSKRADGQYLAGRSREWMKTKCGDRQEFVVVGYTKPQGSRRGLGALVLAVSEGKGLRFAGRVGTGFDERTLVELERTLKRSRVDAPPFPGLVSAQHRRGVLWVEPLVVVEVAFGGWTAEGLLRHPTFEGVREDKSPTDVVRETPAPSTREAKATVRSKGAGTSAEVWVAGVRISHPDRALEPDGRVRKLDVAQYYERVAPLLLPHIADRPLSVLRCPDGFGRACFFQKHSGGVFPESVKSIALRDSGGLSQYLTVDSLEGLIALAQMNVIELHPWGSRRDQLEKPDRMFFDLDPAPGVAWDRVVEAALHLRDVLVRLDIESFVKSTGGKGLHVVVPLVRKYGWDEVKEFSRAIAFELARTQPAEYVANAAKAAREGRIFIDYLRNARGATAVAPYSLRARPNTPISLPISWKALATLESGAQFQLEDFIGPQRLPRGDPWAKFATSLQTLPIVSSRKPRSPARSTRP